jgi:hypothetical protein
VLCTCQRVRGAPYYLGGACFFPTINRCCTRWCWKCSIPSGKCMCMAEQQLDFDGFFFSFPLFFISLPYNLCQPFQKIYVPSFCICINLIFILLIAICFSYAILRCFFNFISQHFISFNFLFNLVLILLIAIF